MIELELKSKTSGKPIHLFGDSFAVIEKDDGTRVLDGLHNNGGWVVKESLSQVVNMIRCQMPE